MEILRKFLRLWGEGLTLYGDHRKKGLKNDGTGAAGKYARWKDATTLEAGAMEKTAAAEVLFMISDASIKGFVIKMAAVQVGNPFEIQDSEGNILADFTPAGTLWVVGDVWVGGGAFRLNAPDAISASLVFGGAGGTGWTCDRLGNFTTNMGYFVDSIKTEGFLGIEEQGSFPRGYWTYFYGGDQEGDITYTLPTGLPAGNYILQCDVNGVLSWIAVPTPAATYPLLWIPTFNITGFTTSLSMSFTANNRGYFTMINVPAGITVTKVWYNCGTVSGNIDIGLYDSTGAKVFTTGAFAPSSGINSKALAASVNVAAGTYWMGISGSSSTCRCEGLRLLYAAYKPYQGYQEAMHPLPNSITLASMTADTNVYWVVLSNGL
jgi:hypothetical protein